MEEQSSRVYYEIIDEVCNKLTEEGPLYDIDRAIVYALQTEWIKNLENVQNEKSTNTVVPVVREAGELEFSDDDMEDYNAEDEIDNIEQNIGCYMMCLFVKVAKSKNKWKCSFKQGFINVDNDDIPFSTATGELEW